MGHLVRHFRYINRKHACNSYAQLKPTSVQQSMHNPRLEKKETERERGGESKNTKTPGKQQKMKF